ncbi:MAG: hypothetical protein ACE5EL_01475 [Anaerolineae bacterium]
MEATQDRRADSEIAAEQSFLQRRVLEIEAAMGAVAARAGTPTGISQPLDALDRARELTNDMYRQVRVRTLADAVAAQLAWLDRIDSLAAQEGGEPKLAMSRTPLDRRLLTDLLLAWRAEQQ